jgi:hypothetical protein
MACITTMHLAYLGGLAWVGYVSLEPNRYCCKIIIKKLVKDLYKVV